MTEIQELATQEPEVIRQEIDETRSALTEKLEALEQQVTGTVERAKDSVEETIANVRESVEETVTSVKETMQDTVASVKETFDLPLQVERRPWLMLGGAAVAGYAMGAMLGRRRTSSDGTVERMSTSGRQPLAPVEEPRPAYHAEPEPQGPSFFDRYSEELDRVKGLGIGLALGLVRDIAKQNLPQLAPQIDRLAESFTTKLGGESVPFSLLSPQVPTGAG